MNLRLLTSVPFVLLPLVLLPTLTSRAQAPAPAVTLRYRWTAGQRLTYLIQRDPYFAEPARALGAVDLNAAYQAPVVSVLTEEVQSVTPSGTATLKVTLATAPGFEDEAHPQPPLVRTLTVTPHGAVSGAGGDADTVEMLRAFFRLPVGPVKVGASWAGTAWRGTRPVAAALTLASVRGGSAGLAVLTQTLPAGVAEGRSPDHDGTLLQTTRTTQTGRIVFDLARGQMVRQSQTLTVTSSLTMTGRGRRGVADFGRVVPNVRAVQTLTMERQGDAP